MTTQDTGTELTWKGEVKALRAEMAELRAEVAKTKSATRASSQAEKPELVIVDRVTDRRQLLRRGGAAAAAAVVGGGALAATQASPAAASTGGSMILGHNSPDSNQNTADKTTELVASGGFQGLFIVQDAAYKSSGYPAAVSGWANGSVVSNGVYGLTVSPGGNGVVGIASSPDGVGVFAAGDLVDLRLSGYGREPVQTSPSRGGFAFTGADNLWFCPVDAPGNWFKLAGPGVAGSLHILPSPVRVYDSRPGTNPPNPNKVRWQAANERVLDATFNSSGVPVAARAVLLNATASNTNPGGFFAFWKSGAYPNTSSLNWGVVNSTVATTTVVALDGTAHFKGRMEGAGGADLIIDIIGYYL